jgi:hypothetical protein
MFFLETVASTPSAANARKILNYLPSIQPSLKSFQKLYAGEYPLAFGSLMFSMAYESKTNILIKI